MRKTSASKAPTSATVEDSAATATKAPTSATVEDSAATATKASTSPTLATRKGPHVAHDQKRSDHDDRYPHPESIAKDVSWVHGNLHLMTMKAIRPADCSLDLGQDSPA